MVAKSLFKILKQKYFQGGWYCNSPYSLRYDNYGAKDKVVNNLYSMRFQGTKRKRSGLLLEVKFIIFLNDISLYKLIGQFVALTES